MGDTPFHGFKICAGAYDSFSPRVYSLLCLLGSEDGPCADANFRQLSGNGTDGLFSCFCAESDLRCGKPTFLQGSRQRYGFFGVPNFENGGNCFMELIVYRLYIHIKHILSGKSKSLHIGEYIVPGVLHSLEWMGIHKSFQFLTSGKAFVIPHALDLDRANGVGSLNGFPQGETLIESAEDAGGKAISSSDGIHKGIFLIRGALEIFFPGGSIGAALSGFYDYSFCTLFPSLSPGRT